LRRNKTFSEIYQCPIVIKAVQKDLTIHVDTARFYQAITQLLQYAMKLCDAKSEVHVRINEDRSRVKIAISLNGKNINDIIRENLLHYFGSQGTALDHDQFAEGDLGLAIAKEIIAKMHGKLTFEYRPDESSFIVEFQQAIKQF
jgi:K+-sensing histidine kinase KdpD